MVGCQSKKAYEKGLKAGDAMWGAETVVVDENRTKSAAELMEEKKKETNAPVKVETEPQNGLSDIPVVIYKVNTITGLFHREDCAKIAEISSGWETSELTKQELLDEGYLACPECKP